jgi:6-phosphogluconolactonase
MDRSEADNRPIETYSFDDSQPAAPALPGEVVTAPTVDDLIDLVAADLVIHAENCLREFGDFHLALSGGTAPLPLYRRLMYDPNYRRLPWRRTHLWLVDDRCVDFDSDDSNYKMIRELIVDHAGIPTEQVHPMPVLSPTGDREYEHELRDTLGWRERGQDRLDYALLGMGTDGHTASLFPHTEPLGETKRLVRFNRTETATPHERMTMTFPLLNASRFIAVLATGAKKASMIQRIATGDDSIADLPIKGIQPINGELKWYLDAAACGETEPDA